MSRCAFLLVLFSLLTGRGAAADPRIGDRAPSLGLPGIDGKLVERDPALPAVVDFYATWCGPCQDALVHLMQLAQRFGPRLSVIIVDVEEPPETVRAYFSAHPLPAGMQVVLDKEGAASARWGRHRFPTTFLVDQTGVIRFINRGYGPGYGERILSRVRPLVPDAGR